MKILAALTSIFAPMEPVLSSDGVSARFARMLTDRNNPDHIIAAHIMQDMAKNFESWTAHTIPSIRPVDRKGAQVYQTSFKTPTGTLTNGKIAVELAFTVKQVEYHHSASLFVTEIKVDRGYVNSLTVPDAIAKEIFSTYQTLQSLHQETARIAALAKAEMEANEKKWEIVESVLGMKRTAEGALVAKASPCVCECELCKTLDCDGDCECDLEDCDCDLGETCATCG